MTDLAALRALHDAVKAGGDVSNIVAATAFPPASTPSFRLSGQYMQGYEAVIRAYHGSLDAAHALHTAVLPGWVWNVVIDSCTVWRDYPDNPMDGVQDEYCEGNPARAWLLAILAALIAQQEGK